jgi:hypothetical protein
MLVIKQLFTFFKVCCSIRRGNNGERLIFLEKLEKILDPNCQIFFEMIATTNKIINLVLTLACYTFAFIQ